MNEAGKTLPQWQTAIHDPQHPWALRLRLAAMVGHMQGDRVTARRAALIDLLSDGFVHAREAIWEQLSAQLGADIWGKRPHETLQRDLKALRRGGINLAYSRRANMQGYYLAYPPIKRASSHHPASHSQQQLAGIRTLSVAAKNEQSFAAAAFALKQKELILQQQHPNWTAEAVAAEARRLVYGTQPL